MLVTLLTAADADGDRVSISALGLSGSALWRGKAQDAGSIVDVELELRDELEWSDISFGKDGDPVEPGAQDLLVRGFVEGLDAQGVIIVRLALGIVLIDTVGEPPFDVVGQPVSMAVRDVEVFPTKSRSFPPMSSAAPAQAAAPQPRGRR